MTKIVCKDTNCQHNCCSQCLKESIKVSKRAFCHSFDGKNDNLPNKKMMDYKEEFAKEMDTEMVDTHYIYCEAKNCVSNENGYCVKNSIEVRKKDFGAKCVSFQER